MIIPEKVQKLTFGRRSRRTSILGLTFDGGRLEALVLRRVNGGLEIKNSLSVPLSLDLLTNDPELVGREIRNHLDAAEVRERECVVGLPLKWALTAHVAVPDLPEPDIISLLQIEAERSFHSDVSTLLVAISRCRGKQGNQHALLVGVPRNHLSLLESGLRAAKLRPLSFSLGVTALQPPKMESVGGVMALAIGETHVALQITAGGGIAALRALEGALDAQGSQRVLHANLVAREARITLGQLPADEIETVRRIRIFGPADLSQQLADEMELRLDSMGLIVERVMTYPASEFNLQIPPETPVRPVFSLAAEYLAGLRTTLEFLPPRVSPWKQMTERYASGKLRTVLSAAGAVGLLVGGLFFYQQCQLWRLQSQWSKMAMTVGKLEGISKQISQYRPWYDESVKGLTILRGLAQAFPEDGSITAKTVEIRDLGAVTCTGTARNYQVLLQTLQKLRAMPQVRDANLGPTRGQTPALQFSFSFAWVDGGKSGS